MPRIPLSDLGTSTADRIVGHRPELLTAWVELRRAVTGPSSTLSAHLKEEVRRTLAQRTGCRYCASLGQPAFEHPDRRESLAVAFADMVAEDYREITDAQVRTLFDEFSTAQVVELLVWISFEYAGQLFGSVVGDEPATAEEKQAFAAGVSSRDELLPRKPVG